jgi:sedoheptulokinase
MCFLGIDIGTSSICGVAYETSSGDVMAITKDNDTDISSSRVVERVQDPVAILNIVSELIHEFRLKYPLIKGIGFSGQMHGMLYVDAGGSAVSPLYTWQDGRGDLPYRDGLTYAAWLSRETGLPLSTGYGLVSHFYNGENGLVAPEAAKLCTIMDYVVMRLAGKGSPLTDPSNAAGLGFFDKEHLVFDRQALNRVSIDAGILPEIAGSASLAGYYDGIPLYTAIGDNQAAFLGSVRDIAHSIHVTVGTSGQLSVYSERYIEVPPLDTRPLPGGGYILVGAALCGGLSLAILKSFFGEAVRLCSGREMTSADLYSAIISIPYKADSGDDPVTSTLFEGTRLDPALRGGISNISVSNFTPENLILSFLKGITRELYDFYRQIPHDIRNNKTILVGSGNGIRKNHLLHRAFEERFGCPLQISKYREEAAFGASVCAMVGSGHIKNFSDFESS